MTSDRRAVLSLGGEKKGTESVDDDKKVTVGVFDLLLPSRQFFVHHKVAALGEVSLTAEFLLRLLHSLDGLSEVEIASFFDFNERELAFVVREAEERAFIVRRDGCVWLTEAGYALFKGGDKPQIFEVHKQKERVGFDLVAMAPAEFERLSEFEAALPELTISDARTVSSASKLVPDAFRKHFSEISSRREKDLAAGVRRSLYSVDAVEPSDRFSSIVPVVAVANLRRPGELEPTFDAWRTGHELEDRTAVVRQVATFLDGLKVARRREDHSAYEVLSLVAPEFLKEYLIREGLSVHRYFREIAVRAGEFRSDRPTIGVVGPLYSPENGDRLMQALRHSVALGAEESFLWSLPSSPTWGASRTLDSLLSRLTAELGKKKQGDSSAFALVAGKPSKIVQKAFDQTMIRPDNGSIPASLEILLIPGRVAAITVHAPLSDVRGFPIPLGVLSFDDSVVRRAHDFLRAQLPSTIQIVGEQSRFDLQQFLEWPRKSVAAEPLASDSPESEE